ncbi:transcriptional regulator, TetR family [Amphibacillus marinus]|uniref:Transcriptional regulator, TetR family n=1 Tax=Amphibacillus marinus TaxID=872970 RepID=A0A1H8PJ06_9BACI|nr:TetR/AcrR family transcriptional regulator [Amphibacillus marinus]SEO41687.1 transcriptional regulator, TetR family [Amphibacillus marinus]
MSAEKIKQAALQLFAAHGYDGTSLAQIATAVGIKKQSIYTHFQGKDQLFLALIRETFEIERKREEAFFSEQEQLSLKHFLENVLASYLVRFDHDDRLKFWLRNTFLPPKHLYPVINKQVNQYILDIETIYLPRFEQAVLEGEISRIDASQVNLAFSALLDSIEVELIYGDQERVKEKMNASWSIFWNGIC